jgi:hypothetical protein
MISAGKLVPVGKNLRLPKGGLTNKSYPVPQ